MQFMISYTDEYKRYSGHILIPIPIPIERNSSMQIFWNIFVLFNIFGYLTLIKFLSFLFFSFLFLFLTLTRFYTFISIRNLKTWDLLYVSLVYSWYWVSSRKRELELCFDMCLCVVGVCGIPWIWNSFKNLPPSNFLTTTIYDKHRGREYWRIAL